MKHCAVYLFPPVTVYLFLEASTWSLRLVKARLMALRENGNINWTLIFDSLTLIFSGNLYQKGKM